MRYIVLLLAVMLMSLGGGWALHSQFNLYCYDYGATDCVTKQEALDILVRARDSHLIDEPFHQQWLKNYDMVIKYVWEKGQ